MTFQNTQLNTQWEESLLKCVDQFRIENAYRTTKETILL